MAWGTVGLAFSVAGTILVGILNIGWGTSLWMKKLGALQMFVAGAVFISYVRYDWADRVLRLLFLLGAISLLIFVFTPRHSYRRDE